MCTAYVVARSEGEEAEPAKVVPAVLIAHPHGLQAVAHVDVLAAPVPLLAPLRVRQRLHSEPPQCLLRQDVPAVPTLVTHSYRQSGLVGITSQECQKRKFSED